MSIWNVYKRNLVFFWGVFICLFFSWMLCRLDTWLVIKICHMTSPWSRCGLSDKYPFKNYYQCTIWTFVTLWLMAICFATMRCLDFGFASKEYGQRKAWSGILSFGFSHVSSYVIVEREWELSPCPPNRLCSIKPPTSILVTRILHLILQTRNDSPDKRT